VVELLKFVVQINIVWRSENYCIYYRNSLQTRSWYRARLRIVKHGRRITSTWTSVAVSDQSFDNGKMKEEELLTAKKPTPITRDVHTSVDYCTRRRTSQRQQTDAKKGSEW